MTEKVKEDLQQNLERIKELTETVVPFNKTTIGTSLIDYHGGKKAILKAIHKDEDYAIAVAEIEEGFIHQSHFHEEYEILCLLEGDAIVKFPDREIQLQIHEPILIDKRKVHEVFYIKNTKVLTITIPASKDFPNQEEEIS